MYNIKIIIASTRPGRKGPAIAGWFYELAKKRPHRFELIDLAEVNLPFLDEPNHPSMRKYTQQHTKDWSAKIDDADGFIVILPEYNHAYPATIKNALDYLFQEWQNKPIGFVSYGGISAGTRSVQQLKPVVTALKMMPIPEAVTIPFFTQYINDEGIFTSGDSINKSAETMLNELLSWAEALKPMRVKQV